MIESLRISGFKLFRDLTLPRLGRINLFVGENNSGKSCLLEAISLYAGQSPVVDLLQTAGQRSDEVPRPWDPIDLTEEGTSIKHPVFDLFYRSGRSSMQEFVIGKVADSQPLRVRYMPHQVVRDEQGFVRYAPLVDEPPIAHDGIEIALPVYRGERVVGLVTRRRLPLLPSRMAAGVKFANEDGSAVAFLPANGFSNSKAASLWDSLVQGTGQELVLDWLRILDSGIEDIAYIAGRRNVRIALLKFRDQGRIPLRSMGDGFTKLFHIALAVASASRGVLLIDEFENGLHWSVQEKLWTALAQAARDFEVQIFATTHSRDCIESFAAAAEHAGPGFAAIYRLERTNRDVIAAELPLVNVDAALREHAEVR